MENKIMLITYADSFGRNLKELKENLDTYFQEAIGAVHILPFFPSSGDRGFAPLTYEEVDPAFGTWEDIHHLHENYELMCDFMVNHLSRRSAYFRDFQKKHEESKYKEMFLRFQNFWPQGEPTSEEVAMLNKRKPYAPCVEITFPDGGREKIWCTFEEEQMDLDLRSAITWEFVENSLNKLADEGFGMIRMDAFAFVTKKYGTDCFFVEPDIWEIMRRVEDILTRRNVPILPEIHDHYKVQQKIADHGYWVYDFALPALVLHTFYTKDSIKLKHWMEICPQKAYTTLDTHDGIGMIDVEDLLTEEERENVCRIAKEYGASFKMDYSDKAAGGEMVYQIDCTYYSALGSSDEAYLCARAIQFFAPGIPQVYYVGMLAGENDEELAKRTKTPRDINRHNFTSEEIRQAVDKPVVQRLIKLMKFRNEYPAFEGPCVIEETPSHVIEITRSFQDTWTKLYVDLKENIFEITYYDLEEKKRKSL